MDATVTVRDLLRQTAEVVGSAREARWLVEVATELDGAEFDSALTEPATIGTVTHLDLMVARYLAGEPLQYVMGRWSFRHLDLAVDRRVLIPRPETELVAGVAIELAAAVPSTRSVVDLGTGSGAIGLSLANELPIDGTTVWITDVSDDALAVAKANLAGLGRAAVNVRTAHGSWFEALPDDAVFDVVVSNPPYVAESSSELAASVRDWEPACALFAGADGLDAIRIIVRDAAVRLRSSGWLVLEIGSDQGAAVADLLAATGYHGVEIRGDLAGHDRIAIGRRPR